MSVCLDDYHQYSKCTTYVFCTVFFWQEEEQMRREVLWLSKFIWMTTNYNDHPSRTVLLLLDHMNMSKSTGRTTYLNKISKKEKKTQPVEHTQKLKSMEEDSRTTMLSAIHKPPWLLPTRFYSFPFHPLIQKKKCCFHLLIQIKEMTQDTASVYFFLAHVDF